MFNCPKPNIARPTWAPWLATAALCVSFSATAQTAYPGLGRAATAPELAAWDTDVRPDFKGLPPGSGTVAQGQDIWETRCASCHGVFGENNEVFTPLIGGTTAADVKSGRVARLTDDGYPGRTTLMKLATLSTLWDYIYRAMPWNSPKSLTVDQVYAVTAYMLHLGDVLPQNFKLSHTNMASVQALLPNRLGNTTDHGLWPGRSLGNGGKPDVTARACMKDCGDPAQVASALPDFARNSHGNLAEQQRLVGPMRGAVTDNTAANKTAQATPGDNALALALLQKHSCTACHGMQQKIVGPGFAEVGKKYAGQAGAATHLQATILAGGQGVWGPIPMPAQTLPAEDAAALARWFAAGAPQK